MEEMKRSKPIKYQIQIVDNFLEVKMNTFGNENLFMCNNINCIISGE